MASEKLDLQDKLAAFKSVVAILGAPLVTAATGDPFVGAGVTNLFLETFFGIQGGVKLRRAHTFISKLQKGIEAIDGSFEIDDVDKVDFGDLLESAILKSTKARTDEKLDRFKQIIINQLLDPVEFDYASKYLELVEGLSEKQFIVLSKFAVLEQKIVDCVESRKKLELRTGINWEDKHLDTLKSSRFQKEVNEMNELSHQIIDLFEEKKFVLKIFDQDEKHFMQSELKSWGLIYNPAEGKISETGHFYHNKCTPFAVKFIDFVEGGQ